MSLTIPGGAYLTADGKWIDANGKPLPADVVAKLQEQAEEKSFVENPQPPQEQVEQPDIAEEEAVPPPKKRIRKMKDSD